MNHDVRQMNLPEYEYKGLIAQAWDVLRGDTSSWPDRSFYLQIIRKYGQPVLDVGCGTGRLLLDYLQQDIDIDGVDNSPDMLALCRQKAANLNLHPTLYEQYMEALELPRKYQTILIPSSSFQLIIDPDMVDQALKRLSDHLLPGGAVSASFMKLRKDGDPLEFEWEQSAVREKDGVKFRRVIKSRYDPESQYEHTEDLYQMIVEEKVMAEEAFRRSPATVSYDPTQVQALFERAGFEDSRLYSQFTFEPAKQDDNVFTVLARKSVS